MSNIKLKSLLLKEEFYVSDMMMLEKACKAFADTLIQDKIVAHQHKDLTAADTPISQYSEDIAEVVRNEVIKWMDVSNRRGGR